MKLCVERSVDALYTHVLAFTCLVAIVNWNKDISDQPYEETDPFQGHHQDCTTSSSNVRVRAFELVTCQRQEEDLDIIAVSNF